MAFEISTLLKVIGLTLLILFVLKLLFPTPKKISAQHFTYKRPRFYFYILSLGSLLLLIALIYFYGLDFITFLQRIVLHSSKGPLLIEVKNGFAFLVGIFLLILSTYFLILIPFKKYYGKEHETILMKESLKIGINISSVLKIITPIYIILVVITIGLFIWSFDYYIVADETGIYYNSIETFARTDFYDWNKVDKILYIVYIENDGVTYKQLVPYYLVLMKDNRELDLSGSPEQEQRWIHIIKEKSGAKVYEKRGNNLSLIN